MGFKLDSAEMFLIYYLNTSRREISLILILLIYSLPYRDVIDIDVASYSIDVYIEDVDYRNYFNE